MSDRTLTPADLADLTRSVEAMTEGPWRVGSGQPPLYAGTSQAVADGSPEAEWPPILGAPPSPWVVASANPNYRNQGAGNIAGIVALRNAAPRLLATIAALTAENERLRAEVTSLTRLNDEQQREHGADIDALLRIASAVHASSGTGGQTVEACWSRERADAVRRVVERARWLDEAKREMDAARLDAASARAVATEAIEMLAEAMDHGADNVLSHVKVMTDHGKQYFLNCGDEVDAMRARLAHPDAERLRAMASGIRGGFDAIRAAGDADPVLRRRYEGETAREVSALLAALGLGEP